MIAMLLKLIFILAAILALTIADNETKPPKPLDVAAQNAQNATESHTKDCVPSGQPCLICTSCPACCSGSCSLNGMCL